METAKNVKFYPSVKLLNQYIFQLCHRGGLLYERGGDARRLDKGCKFRILVSLRAFWAKRHYI